MSKKIDKIENRVIFHQQQLAQLKAKKKEEVSKNKEGERRKRVRFLIEMGANICKVLGISHLEIDEHLPSVIGYLDLKKQNLKNNVYSDRGKELLESWKTAATETSKTCFCSFSGVYILNKYNVYYI